MIRTSASRLLPLKAAAALLLLLMVVATRPAAAQSIINQIAGIQQIDGTYLWQYQVTSSTGPAISHWTLTMCDDVFDSLVHGSLVGAGRIEYTAPDPTTGVTGLKFEPGFEDGEVRTVRFRLSQDWAPELKTAKTKSGGQVDTFSILGPDCELRNTKTAIPENGTATLALAALLPLTGIAAYRRRRHRHCCIARHIDGK